MIKSSSTLVVSVALILATSGGAAWAAGSGKEKSKVHSYTFSSDQDVRGYLGVQVEEDVDLDSGGARIIHVTPDSPAERAGLEPGDVIIGVEGRTVRGPMALRQALGETKPGDRVEVEVMRDGHRERLSAELGEGPHYHWKFQFAGSQRPLLGVELVQATPDLREHLGGDRDRGVLVGRVIEDSAAEKAGIRVGDLIVAVERDPVEDVGDLSSSLREHAGETVRIEVIRDGRATEVRADLPERDQPARTTYRRTAVEARRAYATAMRAANEARREALRGVRTQYRQALATYRQSLPHARRADVTLY